MHKPPAHIEPFVEVLGVDRAVDFFLEFGGAEMYFAGRPQDRGRLAAAIGQDAVRALADMMLPRRVPTAKPWIAQVLRHGGLSVAEIARKLHVSDVSVRRWLKSGHRNYDPSAARQFPLF